MTDEAIRELIEAAERRVRRFLDARERRMEVR